VFILSAIVIPTKRSDEESHNPKLEMGSLTAFEMTGHSY